MSEHKYSAEAIEPKIREFLNPILRHAGFQLDLEAVEGEHTHPDFEDPEVVVKFSGEDVDLLLANRAELLLALEHLAMEVLQVPAEHHSLICFDANDYRVLRIEELRLSAITAAEKVKKTRAPFHFNPMSSRERRIIHLSLRNETGIRSESTGTGSIRQVVIVPEEMKTVPEPIRPPEPREGFRGDGPRGFGSRGDGPRGFGGPRRDGPPRRSGPPRRGR
ncbi:MAG TPA: R3H domain-containing nucleic acid-binding protein [Bryobacteraceae bacterium]|nr:R3H domain-containing nucleic acid-binding protein [Bryobacteraceae bacterium]